MVITFVIDLFGDKNNGTTITAMRTAEKFVQHGHEVRIIAYIPDTADPEDLKNYKLFRCYKIQLPVFDWLVTANGFTFADANEKDIAEFIKGSDVVHLMLPFLIESKARKVAKAMSIPVTSAYHLQPDSISYNIGLGKIQVVNAYIYHIFYKWVYRFTRTVHTPSETMRKLMISHGYHGDIHAISNGVSPYFVPINVSKPEKFKDKYIIMMIGRLSGEKRQDLIIKAVGKSKYNDRIQLIFCGQGPKKHYLMKLSKKCLKNQPIFKFTNQKELRDIINYSDLYIHASDIESEAIACIEAFCCGKVPIISDSRFSATNHFALSPLCLFKAGNPQSLTTRIEYFIEHPEEVKELSEKYIEYGKTFEIESKVDELSKVMELEIQRDQEDHRLHRTYYSSFFERLNLKRVARKIGCQNPYIVKKDIYHDTDEYSNRKERKEIKHKKR